MQHRVIAPESKRVTATVIDDTIFGLAIVAVIVFLSSAWDVSWSGHLRGDQVFVALALMLSTTMIPVVVAALTGGRTIGKLIAGIRAVRVDGEPYDLAFAYRRDFWSKYVVWGYHRRGMQDWNLLKADPQKRSGHDLDCGTIVVLG